MQHPWLVGGKASDKGLPGVHHERLVGYQALTQMRNTMAALRLDTAALFKVFSKDGEIDKAQLKQAFRSIGTDLSDEAVNGVMQVPVIFPADALQTRRRVLWMVACDRILVWFGQISLD
jgi:hypothetical protein